MNQRTTELYQQALEFTYNKVPKENWNADILHPIVSGKFAELIIKETLQVARAGIEYGDSMEDAVYKYFGVE